MRLFVIFLTISFMSKIANTQVPYLSKTWAYNLTIPVQVLAKESCHISGHHYVLGTQTRAIFEKVKMQIFGFRWFFSKTNPLMPGPSWYMKIKYLPNTRRYQPSNTGNKKEKKRAFQKVKHLHLWVLEHPQLCSIWDPAHSNKRKKSHMCQFGSGKWFFSCIFAQFAEARTC